MSASIIRQIAWRIGIFVLIFFGVALHGIAGVSPITFSFISPTNGAFVAMPARIHLSVTQSGSGPSVSGVAFFSGANPLPVTFENITFVSNTSSRITYDYAFLWSNSPDGDYNLSAVLTDTDRNTRTSGPVDVTVTDVLTADITSPTNGTSFAAPASFELVGVARDFGAYPHLVSFYQGTNQLIQLVSDPFSTNETNGLPLTVSFDITNLQSGDYSYTFVVSDTAGSTVTSAPVNIIVTNPLPPVPVVSIITTDPIAVEGTNFVAPPVAASFSSYVSGTNTATFLVRRVGPTNNDVTVFYKIGGTASNGVDYVALPGDVTIPAGKRYALITIIPIKHVHPITRPFFNTVILSLFQPPDIPTTYLIGFPAKAEAIILENYPWPYGSPVAPIGPPIGFLADNSFSVNLPATNGFNYCLETSTDLVTWTPVSTNTVVKGSIQFLDPDAAMYPTQYYRAIPAAAPSF